MAWRSFVKSAKRPQQMTALLIESMTLGQDFWEER